MLVHPGALFWPYNVFSNSTFLRNCTIILPWLYHVTSVIKLHNVYLSCYFLSWIIINFSFPLESDYQYKLQLPISKTICVWHWFDWSSHTWSISLHLSGQVRFAAGALFTRVNDCACTALTLKPNLLPPFLPGVGVLYEESHTTTSYSLHCGYVSFTAFRINTLWSSINQVAQWYFVITARNLTETEGILAVCPSVGSRPAAAVVATSPTTTEEWGKTFIPIRIYLLLLMNSLP